MNTWDFSGKTALVTGGSSGIGRAIAFALAEHGCQVAATGLTVDEVEELNGLGLSRLSAVALDVTDETAAANVIAQFSQLDILVNCAGMILRGGGEFTAEGFERVLETNRSIEQMKTVGIVIEPLSEHPIVIMPTSDR